MKGFVYLLEISIALILMIVVIGTLSSFKSKENWERSDLIGMGDNLMRILDSDDVLEIINGDFSKIESQKPPNVDFGVKISGISKTNISVGCIQYCDYVKNFTKYFYFNNRSVNFSVEQFTIGSSGIPSKYDVVVFVNYTGYTSQYNNITNYLNQGGVVIGINATSSNSNTDFNDIYGLSVPTSSGSGNFNFTSYNPSEDETEKYFIYLGFDVNASTASGSNRTGYWYIWEVSRNVNITSSNSVSIQNKSSSETGLQGLHTNDTFSIINPVNSNSYTFKVVNIDWSKNLTVFQPLDVPFTFKNFTEKNVSGKFDIIKMNNGPAEMTSNNSAIWISDFPWSDEYRVLVRNAIASRVKEWYVNITPDFSKQFVTVSSFYPMCCDMPETVELTIYLWYKV